ncbi:MAG: response regulator [Burkholderiales bacterium]
MYILYVEDDPDARAVTARLMSLFGHEVTAVGTAEEALDVLGVVAHLDALVVDIRLPGMQGDVLAAEARQLRSDLRVVFTTGRVDLHPAALDPFPAFLLKPFTLEELAEALGPP